MNYSCAFLTCACGKEFQVLNEEGTEWTEEETSKEYRAHSDECAVVKEIEHI